MLIEDVAMHLTTNGVGVYDPDSTTGDIFLSFLPATPDACMAIYNTGGQGSALPEDHIRAVQIIVRGLDYESVNSKAWEAYRSVRNATQINGRKVINRPMGVPAHIGQDQNKRHEFSLNFEMWTTGD
jgi:hypothetical protein